MKKLFFTCIFTLATTFLYAQQYSKTETVVKDGASAGIIAIISYDDDMNPTDYLFSFMGQDDTYRNINSVISVFHGRANDMIGFLLELKQLIHRFSNEEITATINGTKIDRVDIIGKFKTLLWNPKGYKYGYILLPSDETCNNFIIEFDNYCKSKNIPYDNPPKN